MHLLLKFLMAFGVGWLARMIEDLLTTTAWGGPFTILAGWGIIVFLSVAYAVAATLIGQLLRLPGIKEAWTQAGCWTLLLSVPPALALAFSSPLGLRTIDPVSNYSLMSYWPSVLCHFFVVFPIANLPTKNNATPPPSRKLPEYDY